VESFLGILVFLLFAAFSLIGKVAKKENDRRGGLPQRPQPPQWPGPVAKQGQPQWPQPGPRPAAPPQWPQAPRQWPGPQGQAQNPAPAAPPEPRKKPPQTLFSDEGESGSMGGASSEGIGTEGPAAGQTFQADRDQFDRDVAGMSAARLERFTEGLAQLGEDSYALPVEAGATELDLAMADRDRVAQAVVMAEVLGKPKGLRARHRRI